MRRRNEFLASKEAQSPAKSVLNGRNKHDQKVLESKTTKCKDAEDPNMSCNICACS